MSYLAEFQLLVETQQYSRFLRLWEEYAQIDVVEGQELIKILQQVKKTPFAAVFGQYAETIIPLWEKIDDPRYKHEVMKFILDLQNTNSALFADLAIKTLTEKYGSHPNFNDFLRLSGLRTRQKFQGSISNFELLIHLQKGNFVYHERGWGVGEVMSVSLVREHALIEFEGIATPKDLSFENAFKNLIPLPSTHFLARRFGDPDSLEAEGREDPVKLIHLLLQDLGPKSAAEIKDELCDLVIPEKDWVKWWQGTRNKLKKDTKIKSAESSKEKFELREQAVTHEERFIESIKESKNLDDLIEITYQYSRDFPEVFKKQEVKESVKQLLTAKPKEGFFSPEKTAADEIQIAFLLQDIFNQKMQESDEKKILSAQNPATVIENIHIVAFKKRFLTLIREKKEDWATVFLPLLFLISQNLLRDYLFKELSQEKTTKVLLVERLKDLLNRATIYPEAYFWYFQKITDEADVPLSDKEHKCQFLEAFFLVLHVIEQNSDYRDLVKKMYQFLTAKRFLMFRSIIEGTSQTYLQEVLLIASKCHSLSKQDTRILASLAEVVQPSLGKKGVEEAEDIIWTTSDGYKKVQERIMHIGTVETVDNAKEIEAARALGDLRENSEYKFALERRARLQGELKTLSKQLNKARILTKEDISTDEVSVGSVVHLVDSKNRKTTYTLLGPWDADPDKGILSVQSKFAEAMLGSKKGDSFEFQGEQFTVSAIASFL